MKQYKTFYELLLDQNKGNVALIFDINGQKQYVTYAELILKIDNYNIPDFSSIGILTNNDIDTIVSIFALAKAKKQIVLLSQNEEISNLKSQIKSTDISCLVGPKDLVNELRDGLCTDKSLPKNGNILFFTSGTTKNNKAVILTEESLCASAFNGGALLPLKESDILLSILPFNHVFGFVCSLLWPLSFSASIALSRGAKHLFDDNFYFNASVISLVPQIAKFLAINKLINKELRLLLIGASSLSSQYVDIFKSFNISVHNGYGLTETSSGIALSINEDTSKMSICPLSKIKIASDGEILLQSDSKLLMKGYYKDDTSTKEVIHDNYFYTGDLGKIDEDGNLILLGRKKDIIVLDDGTKIYCPEYEEQLKTIFDGADLAISLVDKILTLYIYLNKDNNINIEELVYKFNLTKPFNQRIAKIINVDSPIEKTLSGKIKRYKLGR